MASNNLVVGVYLPNGIPESFRVYSENVLSGLEALDVEAVPFADGGNLPRTADVLWDIRSGGGNPPPTLMRREGLPPLVVTVHGFAPMELAATEYYRHFPDRLRARRYDREKVRGWVESRPYVWHLIAVSNFSRQQAAQFARIDATSVTVCYHGVAHDMFHPNPSPKEKRYFLHVSNDEPRKNVDRIVKAFSRFRKTSQGELVLKLPSNTRRQSDEKLGIRIVKERLPDHALADLYRGAIGFLFPSLYEGFGLPILEAMSSGCPVITANVTACAEVAGEAAIQVDPRRVTDLSNAMEMLHRSESLRRDLRQKGLEHARGFSWAVSAKCHLEVFRRAAEAHR